MVSQIRILEKALGSSEYRLTPKQEKKRAGSRSIFVAQDMAEGEVFTEQNIRCIRPGIGLHTMYYEEILGRKLPVRSERGRRCHGITSVSLYPHRRK